MARKKLTKTQVLRAMRIISTNLGKLFFDKLEKPDSRVPLSLEKMTKLHKEIASAVKRVK